MGSVAVQLRLIPIGVLAVNAIVYAVVFPLNEIADAHGAGHFGHAFWQTLAGGALLATVAAARAERVRLSGRLMLTCLVVGATGFSVPLTLVTYVSAALPTGATSLAFALGPTATYLLAVLVRIERLSLWGIVGLFLGFVGVGIIVLPELAGTTAVANLPWFLITLSIPVSLAACNVSAAMLRPPEAPPVSVAAGYLFGAAVSIFPLALATGQTALPLGPGIWWTTLLGGLANAVAITIFAEAIQRYGPTFYVQVNYMIVIAAIGWGWLIFGEVTSGFIWAALAFMAVGIVVAERRKPLAGASARRGRAD